MDIKPEKIENEKDFMKNIMHWRQESHEYEDPKPFKNKEGKMIQTLFCNKCGQSKGWFIHNPPFGESVGDDI